MYVYIYILHKTVWCSTIAIFQQDAAFVRNMLSLCYYIPDEGSLLPKYGICRTPSGFALYLICCGVRLLLRYAYTYIYIHTRISVFEFPPVGLTLVHFTVTNGAGLPVECLL